MPISASHLFGLVAHDTVDDRLRDALAGQVRAHAVAEDVEAPDNLVLRPDQNVPEVMVGPSLVGGRVPSGVIVNWPPG